MAALHLPKIYPVFWLIVAAMPKNDMVILAGSINKNKDGGRASWQFTWLMQHEVAVANARDWIHLGAYMQLESH